MLPASIFEELEDGKTEFNAVMANQVLQELWVCAEYQKRTEEPAVVETKKTLLDVTWTFRISLHLWILIRRYLLRPLPLNHRHVLCILRWTSRIVVQ